MKIEYVFLLTFISHGNGGKFEDLLLSKLIKPDELKQLNPFHVIFPGTKWCGKGTDAHSYDDLGSSADTDICCREHDHCPETIPAGETKYDLKNEGFQSKLSCKCDEQFRKCLHGVNSKTSNMVGFIYFDVTGARCFRKDYQIVGCKKTGGWDHSKCVEYEYNLKSNQTYQWFDIPIYLSIPII